MVESNVPLRDIISLIFLFRSEIYLLSCLSVSEVISSVNLLSDILETDSWTFQIYWFSFALNLFSSSIDDLDSCASF